MTSPQDWTSVVSAVANAVTAAGVLLGIWQLLLQKRIAQLQFEDALAKEYRDLATRIPTKVFFGTPIDRVELQRLRDEFYRYIDLTNEQICLRQRRRISAQVWLNWRSGIESNLSLPAFSTAWSEIKSRTDSFEELRRLERDGFSSDPASWP